MSVIEDVSSPELVLVSPPDLAAQARDALPDYEVEFERWVVEIRAVFAAEAALEHAAEPSRFAAFVFTTLSAAACVTPLVLLLLARSL